MAGGRDSLLGSFSGIRGWLEPEALHMLDFRMELLMQSRARGLPVKMVLFPQRQLSVSESESPVNMLLRMKMAPRVEKSSRSRPQSVSCFVS